MQWLRRLLHDEHAATAIEYAVMLGMILLVVIGAVGTVGTQSTPVDQDCQQLEQRCLRPLSGRPQARLALRSRRQQA